MHVEARIRKTLGLLSFFLIIFLAASFAVTGCSNKDKTDPNEIILEEQAGSENGAETDMASEEIIVQKEAGREGVIKKEEHKERESLTKEDVQEDRIIYVEFNGVSTEEAENTIAMHGCEIVERAYGLFYKMIIPQNLSEDEMLKEFWEEPSVHEVWSELGCNEGKEYEIGYILVAFPPETAESVIDEVAICHGCTVCHTSVIVNIWVKMKIPYGASEDAMIEAFLEEPLVLHAEKNGYARAL